MGLGVVALVSLPTVVGVIALDASARRRARAEEEPRVHAVLARLPSSDLALSGGARWLRNLSTEEPWAAFSDGPAFPDPDPAGGVVAPPIEVWSREPGVGDVRIHRGAKP